MRSWSPRQLQFGTMIALALLLYVIHRIIVNNDPVGNMSSVVSVRQTKKVGSEDHSLMNDLDIYVRMTTRKSDLPSLYRSVLVQSLAYFWPNVSLVIVLDGERPEDRAFGETVRKSFPFPKVCYMQPVKIDGHKLMDGKMRMQRDMFYPERCTSKRYVGFVDTDTMFVTRVTPSVLFSGDKPVVISTAGDVDSIYAERWAWATLSIFQTREVMRCMYYFPVVVKVAHLIHLRKYLEKLHNTSFEKVLTLKDAPRVFHNTSFGNILLLGGPRPCQFNLMCQYLWTFHRDEYQFHIKYLNETPQKISLAREDPQYYSKLLTPTLTSPVPRATIHYKHLNSYTRVNHTFNWKNITTYRRVLRSGVCFSGGFDSCPQKCADFRNESVLGELFNRPVKDPFVQVQQKHYEFVRTLPGQDYDAVIRRACDEIDRLNVSFEFP